MSNTTFRALVEDAFAILELAGTSTLFSDYWQDQFTMAVKVAFLADKIDAAAMDFWTRGTP